MSKDDHKEHIGTYSVIEPMGITVVHGGKEAREWRRYQQWLRRPKHRETLPNNNGSDLKETHVVKENR